MRLLTKTVFDTSRLVQHNKILLGQNALARQRSCRVEPKWNLGYNELPIYRDIHKL